MFNSRQIYKLSDKKDDKLSFTKLDDLPHFFSLLPKTKTCVLIIGPNKTKKIAKLKTNYFRNSNKEALELFFILFYHIVCAIISVTRSNFLHPEKREISNNDDIKMEVDNEAKAKSENVDNNEERMRIIQQLDMAFEKLNSWNTHSKSMFGDQSVYIISTLKYLGAVKKEFQM